MKSLGQTRRDVIKSALFAAAAVPFRSLAQGNSTASAGQFTYYLDNNSGSDSNTGLSPDSPFQTIAKVNSLSLKPGQSVGFKAGGVWRETLTVSSSGSSNAGQIQFGTYGTSLEPTTASWTQGKGALAQDDPADAIFVSGFEAASLSDWNGGVRISGGTPSLTDSTNQSAHGNSCLCFTGDGHDNRGVVCQYITPITAGETYFFRLYLRTPSGSLAPNNGLKYIQFFSPSGQLGYAELYTDANGRISSLTVNMYGGGGYLQNLSLAGSFLMDQWNYLEIAYKVDATAGSIQSWVNGRNVGNSGALNTSAGLGLNQIEVGNDNYGAIVPSGSSIYFDDVKVASTGPIGAFPVAMPTNVWSTPQTSNPLYPTFNGNPGSQVGSIAALTSVGQWYWDGSGTLYVYGATNPASSVEIFSRQYATIKASALASWNQGSGSNGSEDSATALFASGFETSNLSDWNGGVNINGSPVLAVSANEPAHGNSCLSFTGDGHDNRGVVRQSISPMTAGSTYYFRLYLRTPSGSLAPNNGLKYIQFFSSNAQLGYAELYTDANGRISSLTINMYSGGGCVANVNVAAAYVMDQWNYVEIAYKVDPIAGSIQAWVNGQSVCDSGSLNTSAGLGLNQIQVGNDNYGPIVPKGSSIYFDDVKIVSTGPIGAYTSGIPSTVWYTTQTTNPLFPSFEGQPGTQVGSIGALKSFGQWYWDGAGTLYVYAAANPASSIEIPALQNSVTLSAASFVTFSNLICSGAKISGLFASGGCNSVTFNSCIFELNWENGGIFFDGNHYQNNGVLSNCILRNNGGSGWNVNGFFSNWLFENNSAYANGQILSGSVDHQFSAGIKIFSISGQDGVGTIFRGNQAYFNGPLSTNGGQGAGLWADTCTGITFCNNVAYGNATFGIFLEKNFGSSAYLNTAYNNARVPYCANLASKVSDGNNASNNKIYNNTCYGGWWGMFCGAYEGNGQSTISNQVWANNIAYGAVNQNFWIDVGGDNDGAAGSGNVYTHNCLGPAFAGFIYWASAGFLNTYGQLDACCNGSSASVQADPMFVNASAGNFQLRSGSPCLATGTQIPNLTGAHPNVGAF